MCFVSTAAGEVKEKASETEVEGAERRRAEKNASPSLNHALLAAQVSRLCHLCRPRVGEIQACGSAARRVEEEKGDARLEESESGYCMARLDFSCLHSLLYCGHVAPHSFARLSCGCLAVGPTRGMECLRKDALASSQTEVVSTAAPGTSSSNVSSVYRILNAAADLTFSIGHVRLRPVDGIKKSLAIRG